ncbi:MAG TPA: HAMP domain-containing sensor histidine kinase [Polyangiaceae bacterium]|jgi:signal transduction histidine kinase
MAGSFRRRLFAITALTVLACAAAITAILYLARTTHDVRAEHARENVTREVERLSGLLAPVPRAERPRRERQSGELRSGYVGAPAEADEGALVVRVLEDAANAGGPVIEDGTSDEGNQVLTAASPVTGGGYVFAFQPVVAGRETRGLRVIVIALALLSFALVIASLRTLAVVERDVSTLRASLKALAKDLRAPIPRPTLRELDEVAGGVTALAEELDAAQKERERLTTQLAERERLAALGRIAAGVAHEVRNPLASMKLRADLARTSGEATPAVARDLDDIASEIGRLDRMVSDLLVVAGRRPGPQTEVDLGELVARRVALLAPWALERGVVVAADGAAPARVDSDAIARALDNLLRNAVEASAAGGHVEAHVEAHDGEARVTVVDQGTGVPSSRAGELFEPFFTTKPSGTGLGLALARAVAAAHGGSLTYAREGDATRFTFSVNAAGPPRVSHPVDTAAGRVG